MSEVVGYYLQGQDNDADMLTEDIVYPKCKQCARLLDSDFHNPSFKLKRKSFDLSHANDVGNVVSLRFKEFCLRRNYRGLVFKDFEREKDFFQLIVSTVVRFDLNRAEVEYGQKCSGCNRFDSVIAMKPLHLSCIDEPLEDGFYRTDMVIGRNNTMTALIIVGLETYRLLKRERFRGLVFMPVYK
ncbi:hypothetical protein WBG78_28985 [Chryseolinea sp. T2]|uniref:hypothetical protein n=1 Tax=Chryseolinea sp. T2 TaxID=3129255 RepID=UPI00307763B8